MKILRKIMLVMVAFLMLINFVACSEDDPSEDDSSETNYTVTYDGNGNTGGSVPVDSNSYTAGQAVTALNNLGSLVKSGAAFDNWNTQVGGSGTTYTPDQVFLMGSTNLTLYAQWSTIFFAVSFNGQGADIEASPISMNIATGNTVGSLPTSPQKTGFVFGGWFTTINGGGSEFTTSTSISADITVYAKWSVAYTVSYDSQFADISAAIPAIMHIIAGEAIGTFPTVPQKTGFIFGGWFTETSGNGVEITTNTTITANLTVYAKWIIVYVAGSEYSGIDYVAKYWKNGVEVVLSAGMQGTEVSAMQVVGGDVHVVGRYDWYLARYWKNGVATDLTDGTHFSSARALQVVGSDVYVAGYDNNVAKYWKNGVAVDLTDGTEFAHAFAIQVVGSDVFVAGKDGSVAKYWKNGVAVDLTDGTEIANANAIQVVGSDVYVVGYEINASGNFVAKYWKNGVAVDLTDGTKDAQTYAIQVVGSDVYVAGSERNSSSQYVAKYWKNGVAVDLTDGTQAAYADAMQVVVE